MANHSCSKRVQIYPSLPLSYLMTLLDQYEGRICLNMPAHPVNPRPVAAEEAERYQIPRNFSASEILD